MRKLIFKLMALALMVFMPYSAFATEAQSAVSESDVHVERTGASFRVALSIHVPAPPSLAWAVLTDFDHMAEFLPDLNSSQVIGHSDNLLKVKQEGIARSGFFSTHFESIREIRLSPQNEIRAHGVGGNIKQMESVMQLHAEDEGTRLTYHAEVTPGFWFPPFIGPALVRHQTAEQFSAMVQEMQRRH